MLAGSCSLPKNCKPSRSMPIVAFHGEADEFVSYAASGPGPQGRSEVIDQDTQAELTGFEDIPFRPIPEALQWWAETEGCSSPASKTQVTALLDPKSADGADARDQW